MVNKNVFLGIQVIACICFTTIYSEPTGRACYHAKVCVHNAVEKCGIDSKGKLRKFIDSCDIKEYNCLKGTDFEKTLFEKCASLPSPKEDRKKEDKTKENEEVKNQSQDASETATKKPVASKNKNDNLKKKKDKIDKKEENKKPEKEDSANIDQAPESVAQVNADKANGVSEENVGKGPKKNVENKDVSKSQANVENDGADSEGNAKDNDNSQNNDNDNDNDNEEHDDEVHEDNKKIKQ